MAPSSAPLAESMRSTRSQLAAGSVSVVKRSWLGSKPPPSTARLGFDMGQNQIGRAAPPPERLFRVYVCVYELVRVNGSSKQFGACAFQQQGRTVRTLSTEYSAL